MMRVVPAVLAMVLVASPAAAEKSRKKALMLAGVGTGVSSALVLSSFLIKAGEVPVFAPTFYAGLGSSVITPSLGQWYAGKWLTIGMAVRVAAAGMAAFAVSQRRNDPCFVDPTAICPTFTGTGFTVLSLAAIAYVGGVAYDVIDTPNAVEQHNRTHAMLVPAATDRSVGLAVVGRW